MSILEKIKRTLFGDSAPPVPPPDLPKLTFTSTTEHDITAIPIEQADFTAEQLEILKDWDRAIETGEWRKISVMPLHLMLARYKNTSPNLPQEIHRYSFLLDDFILAIFRMDPGEVYLSDGSALWHFPEDAPIYQDRIARRYDVEIADLPDGNLLKIFQRIEARARRDSNITDDELPMLVPHYS